MTYDEALEYMEGLSKRGIRPGLEGISILLKALNNPQDGKMFIHVVGTNGKGSTSLFISEILRKAGLKVGIYSSPAVFSELEIIKVNGRNISKTVYGQLVDIMSKANTIGCTRFEVETALAFMYFAKENCDIAIIEAGMGGSLDATNIISESAVSVFTAIGIDHTAYLGDTIEAIAENKAGVIKQNSIAVSTLQADSVLEIIGKVAKEHNSGFILSDYKKATKIKTKLAGTTFSYKGIQNIELSLTGVYQIQNACLAIDVVMALKDMGMTISEKNIKEGLKASKECGRFEQISDKPLFFVDGAHNGPASIRLKENIETYFTKKKIIYIMGMFRDKACEEVVKNTAPLADCIFTVATPNRERSLSAFELAEIVKPVNACVTSLDSIEEAVEMSLMMADKDTVILGFGSLSHLKEIKRSLEMVKKRGVKR